MDCGRKKAGVGRAIRQVEKNDTRYCMLFNEGQSTLNVSLAAEPSGKNMTCTDALTGQKLASPAFILEPGQLRVLEFA